MIHLRDLRSELLLKLQLAVTLGIETSVLVDAQRRVVTDLRRSLSSRSREHPDDIVTQWRLETADAALRFLDSLAR